MSINEFLQECDLMHYKREQRKFFHTQYERYDRREPQTYEHFLKHNYEKLKPIFDKQFIERHLIQIDYTATVKPL